MEKKLIGQASVEQIKSWKKEFGDVYKIEVEDSVCYLKAPSRKVMSYVSTLEGKPVRANEVLLENCWLGGDESIKTEDKKFFGVSAKLAQVIEIEDAEITKL